MKTLFSWYFPHPEVVYFFIWPMIDISHPPRSQQERKGPEEDMKLWMAEKPLKREAKDRLRARKETSSQHHFYLTFSRGGGVCCITFEFYFCNCWKWLFLPFAPVLASTSNCCQNLKAPRTSTLRRAGRAQGHGHHPHLRHQVIRACCHQAKYSTETNPALRARTET